jgi:hypothetical protein
MPNHELSESVFLEEIRSVVQWIMILQTGFIVITYMMAVTMMIRAEGPRFDFREGKFLLFTTRFILTEAQAPSCQMCTRGSSPGVEWSQREVDHSHLSNAEVKKE